MKKLYNWISLRRYEANLQYISFYNSSFPIIIAFSISISLILMLAKWESEWNCYCSHWRHMSSGKWVIVTLICPVLCRVASGVLLALSRLRHSKVPKWRSSDRRNVTNYKYHILIMPVVWPFVTSHPVSVILMRFKTLLIHALLIVLSLATEVLKYLSDQ